MSSIDIITPYFRKNRPRIVVGMVSLIIVDILQLIIPRIIKHAVDDLTALGVDGNRLLLYAAGICGIAVFIGLFRYVWRLCLLGTSRLIEEGVRNRLFSHLQTLSAAYFDRTRTGDLMAHATNDVQQIRMAAGMGLVALNDAVVMGAAAIAFMAAIDLRLTCLVLIPMPMIALGTWFFSRRMHRRYQSVQASFSSLTEAVRERFAGIRLIKVHNRKAAETARVEAASSDYIDQNMRLVKITGVFFPMMVLFTNISMAIVLFVGGRQTVLQTITTGDFVAFISYLGLLTWPMMALGWMTNLIQRGRASLDRVYAILNTRADVRSNPNPEAIGRPQAEIRLERVCFAYRGEDGRQGAGVLSDIDLTVEPGSVLGIVGPPGSGKTTLLNLIPRLYDPVAGCIRIDGHDVSRLRLEELRSAIAVVPQEPFLFEGTIAENITFGNPEAGGERLAEAARSAALLETVASFPDGFDTVVGERGVMLSGGQKQRVALARCLITDRPLLILDDPISQVDFETAARIIQTIRSLAGQRTIMLVSHRLSAVRFADRIVVLEGGRIVEAGSHEELLALNRYYGRTYRLQEIEEVYHAA
jgi:ATP-binding cassette subfamily B protein